MVVAENLASLTGYGEFVGPNYERGSVWSLGLYIFGWPSEVNFFWRRADEHFLRLKPEEKNHKMCVDHYCQPLKNKVIIAFIVVIIKHNHVSEYWNSKLLYLSKSDIVIAVILFIDPLIRNILVGLISNFHFTQKAFSQKTLRADSRLKKSFTGLRKEMWYQGR